MELWCWTVYESGKKEKKVSNWREDSFIKLHQVQLVIPPSASSMYHPLPGVSRSTQPTIQPACDDHPCVHMSDVGYSVTHTMLPDCQPFVHKDNGFSQTLPGSFYYEALLLISTSTCTEQLVGILIGGLGSFLQLWNKIAWCAAVSIECSAKVLHFLSQE